MGSRGGEDSHCPGRTETGGVWDKLGRQSATSRPCGPTFAQINREGRTQSGRERGRQWGGRTPRPHIRTQVNREEGGGAGETKQTEQPRAPAWGNTASNL